MNKKDTDAILAKWDGYICSLALQYVRRTAPSSATLELDIDELAQQARFKLWLALKRTTITNHKAYIKSIIHNEVVNKIRRNKGVLPLSFDDDGELLHAHMSSSEELQDPAYVVEQVETMHDYLERLVEAVHTLPPCQQHAMLCILKDQVDDLPILATVFKEKHLDLKNIQCPEEKGQIRCFRASLWISRQKMRKLGFCGW